MVIDFRRKVPVYSDVVIKGEIVEKVETNRYLVIVIIDCHGNKILSTLSKNSQPLILLE